MTWPQSHKVAEISACILCEDESRSLEPFVTTHLPKNPQREV